MMANATEANAAQYCELQAEKESQGIKAPNI
jgi:hypothetical protein